MLPLKFFISSFSPYLGLWEEASASTLALQLSCSLKSLSCLLTSRWPSFVDPTMERFETGEENYLDAIAGKTLENRSEGIKQGANKLALYI